MPTVTIRPDATDPSASGTPTGAATQHACTNDNSDSTYILSRQGFGDIWGVGCGNPTLPSGGLWKSRTIRYRMAQASGTTVAALVSAYDSSTWATTLPGTWANQNLTTTPTTYSTATYTYPSTAAANAEVNNIAVSGGVQSFGPRDSYIYEVYVDLVYAAQPSASAITPSGSITTTRLPTIGWTFNQGTDGSGGQTGYQVRIFSAAQYGAGGFDPETSASTYDSSFVASATNSHTISSPLANGITYKAYVKVWQTTVGTYQPAAAFTAGSTFTINITVPVPTAVEPINGATVSSSRPALNAQVGAMTTGSYTRREWQFATNSGFSANVRTYLESVGNLAATQTLPVSPIGMTRLYQGVWYVRCRALDQDGVYGSYSAATQSFTVAHVPSSGSWSPSAGITLQYTTTPTLSWVFSDPDNEDLQTKFQVLLWKTSTPGTVLDSGLLTDGNWQYQFTSGIDATYKDTEIRWKVNVYDQDNVASGYSIEQTFFLRDPDVIAITNPAAAAVITTPAPNVTWTNTLSGGRTQAQYKVDIVRAAVNVYSSGWITSSTPSHQVTSPVVTIGPTHTVTVTVIDSAGITGTQSNNFTASYASPTNPSWSVNQTNYPLKGYNLIDWTGATADSAFYAWRVYRRPALTGAYTLLYETTSVTTRSYKDYFAPSLEQQEYAVVQVTISFATQTESTYIPQSTYAQLLKYVLHVPANDSMNLSLESVKDDEFEDEVEQYTVNLINRGRRRETGSNFGAIGGFTAIFRDNTITGLTAHQQRLAFEAIRAYTGVVYLKKPQGDMYQVALTAGKVRFVAGTGTHEYAEVSVEYSEITA